MKRRILGAVAKTVAFGSATTVNAKGRDDWTIGGAYTYTPFATGVAEAYGRDTG